MEKHAEEGLDELKLWARALFYMSATLQGQGRTAPEQFELYWESFLHTPDSFLRELNDEIVNDSYLGLEIEGVGSWRLTKVSD